MITTTTMTIGRTRTGEAWHVVKHAGTAFPVAVCGANIDRRTYVGSVPVPAEGIAFHPWQCTRCRNIIAKP